MWTGRTLCDVSVEIRASDEDRDRVIATLQRHTAAGRLTLEEFSDRVGQVYAARTLADLGALVHDLPADPPPAPPSTVDSSGRHLAIAFAVAVATLILLGVVMALR